MSQKSPIKSSSYFLAEKEHFVINKNKEMDVCVKWFIPGLTTFGYVCFLPNPQVAIHKQKCDQVSTTWVSVMHIPFSD